MSEAQAVIGSAVGVVAILTGVAGWLKVVRPWWRGLRRDYIAGRDALVGRDAVVDSITGRELAPALPGIGQRMANVETAIVAIAQQQQDITELKTATEDIDHRVSKLEAAYVERIVTKQESAQAWRAIESAINAEPDEFTD